MQVPSIWRDMATTLMTQEAEADKKRNKKANRGRGTGRGKR